MTYGHIKQNIRILPIAVFLPSGFELMKPEKKYISKLSGKKHVFTFGKQTFVFFCQVIFLGLCQWSYLSENILYGLGTIYDGLVTPRERESGN